MESLADMMRWMVANPPSDLYVIPARDGYPTRICFSAKPFESIRYTSINYDEHRGTEPLSETILRVWDKFKKEAGIDEDNRSDAIGERNQDSDSALPRADDGGGEAGVQPEAGLYTGCV